MGELLVRYEESGIDERILRAVEEMGFVHMTPIQEKSDSGFSGRKRCNRTGADRNRQDSRVRNPDAAED